MYAKYRTPLIYSSQIKIDYKRRTFDLDELTAGDEHRSKKPAYLEIGSRVRRHALSLEQQQDIASASNEKRRFEDGK